MVEPSHDHYGLVKNVIHCQNYVAEYALHSYPLTDEDILSWGDVAWDSALNTVNVGKFNQGCASIGICTHAFYEAIKAGNFNFLGQYKTDSPHIKSLFVDAYCRLAAMRLFSRRAADYMRSASPTDQRYLLYNSMAKMKVSTQGETVIDLLRNVITSKGLEKDICLENAIADIRALPKLERTVHANMSLIVNFMSNYFFNPDSLPLIPECRDLTHDAFLFNQGPTELLDQICFHDYSIAYNAVDLPNIVIFRDQVETLIHLLVTTPPDEYQITDMDYLSCLGELFALVVYGQLLIEKHQLAGLEDDLLDQIFDFMIRDFSTFAINLHNQPCITIPQMKQCLRMIKKPANNEARFERLWHNCICNLMDCYEMAS
jgi:acyl-CoA dehydrogenase